LSDLTQNHVNNSHTLERVVWQCIYWYYVYICTLELFCKHQALICVFQLTNVHNIKYIVGDIKISCYFVTGEDFL